MTKHILRRVRETSSSQFEISSKRTLVIRILRECSNSGTWPLPYSDGQTHSLTGFTRGFMPYTRPDPRSTRLLEIMYIQ